MNIKQMKLPIIILTVGILLAVLAALFTCMLKEPTVKEQDFAYAVTYRLDGTEHTLSGVFKCRFDGYDIYDDATLRNYVGEYTQSENSENSETILVAQKGDNELYLVTRLDAAYLMGDPDMYEYESGNEDPYLVAYDAEGIEIDAFEMFHAEIISWTYPEPIENTLSFVGFSTMHALSMLAMLLVGALVVVACILLVKKEDSVTYKSLDGISVVCNLVIGFGAIPVLTIMIWLVALVMNTSSVLYQMYLCVPTLTAFTIAASIVLRRKGFTRSGLIVQFVFPVLFVGQLFLEALITNVFS